MNPAPHRRSLVFALQEILPKANLLPGDRAMDRFCHARFNTVECLSWK
jgi:hypothetical protein